MKHCNQGAKPLQGFGGAATKCKGLRAQPPRCRGLEGRSPPKVQSVRRAQSQDVGGPGGSAPWVYSRDPESSAPRDTLNYVVNRKVRATAAMTYTTIKSPYGGTMEVNPGFGPPTLTKVRHPLPLKG